jgi:hypothetical protein
MNNKFNERSNMVNELDTTLTNKSKNIEVSLKKENIRDKMNVENIFLSFQKILRNILENKMLYFFLLITILFFGIYAKVEYATDTYSIYSVDYEGPLQHFIASGRFITAGFWYIISILNLSITKSYLISFVIGIISITLSQYCLYRMIKKELNNNIISAIISIMVIINAFSIELFMFFEKGIIALSILLNVLALKYLVEFFEGRKKSIVHALIFMTLANFAYQGTVAIFVSIALVYILKFSKKPKKFMSQNIVVALIYGISASLNYVFVKFVFHNSRTEQGGTDILLSIKKVISGLENTLINSYDLLPKYLFVSFLCATILMVFIKIIMSKKCSKSKLYNFFGLVYICVGVPVITVLPQLMVGIDYIWLVPRSTYAIASLIGILIMFLYFNFEVNKKVEISIIFISLLYILIQFVGFQRISIDHYILNYNDKIVSLQVADKINKYEINSGKKISKVAIYKDKNPRYSYQYLICNGDMNVSAYTPDWSLTGVIYVYTGKHLEKTDGSEQIFEQYFKEKDWEYYNDEQLLFTDDILHICVF